LAGRALETFPGDKDPAESWIQAHASEVEAVTLMMKDMQNLADMDYATVSVAVRSLDQLLKATS
jgi:NAD-specific glutamate dehydrogenase